MISCANYSGVSFCVPVLRWTSWQACARPAAEPARACDVSFVDALLRRRLSPLARMALHVAHECAQGLPRLRLVFASRHGELNRTMSMLRDLARSEDLSPTAFSLSVHNTAAGIFSIARQDRSPASAVSAGDETLTYGLLESFCHFEADPDWPVLMVYADEPLPEEYRGFAERRERAHAIALLLDANAERRMTVTMSSSDGKPASEDLQAASFLSSLAHGAAGSWTGSHHTWTWDQACAD